MGQFLPKSCSTTWSVSSAPKARCAPTTLHQQQRQQSPDVRNTHPHCTRHGEAERVGDSAAPVAYAAGDRSAAAAQEERVARGPDEPVDRHAIPARHSGSALVDACHTAGPVRRPHARWTRAHLNVLLGSSVLVLVLAVVMLPDAAMTEDPLLLALLTHARAPAIRALGHAARGGGRAAEGVRDDEAHDATAGSSSSAACSVVHAAGQAAPAASSWRAARRSPRGQHDAAGSSSASVRRRCASTSRPRAAMGLIAAQELQSCRTSSCSVAPRR